MNNKQKLVLLLKEKGSAVSAKDLAKELNVTDRMIRKYVMEINGTKDSYILSGKDGYQMIAYPSHVFENNISQQTLRLVYILMAVTDEDRIVEIASLAEELDVSIATIELDIKQLKKMMETTNLTLLRNHNAVHMEGRESEKRKLYKRIIIQDEHLYSFDSQEYYDFFSLTDLSEIREVIEQELDTYGMHMTDFSLLNLTMHIGISIERIALHNELLEKKYEELEQSDHVAKCFANSVIKRLQDQYHVEIRNDEYEEMQFSIISRIIPEDLLGSDMNEIFQYVQQDSLDFVEHLVKKIARLYHIELFDQIFIAQFALHIEKLMTRLKRNVYQENPLCQTIKDEYPILFDIAVFIANEIQERYHMECNQGELAFLVLHLGNAVNDMIHKPSVFQFRIALLYPMYYDAAQNLISYFKRNIDQELYIDCYHQLQQVEIEKYDFILSAFPLHQNIELPLIFIHPLPHEDDLKKINTLCNRLKEVKIKERFHEIFSVFEECRYVEECYQLNEFAYIHRMCEPLLKSGIINEQFQQEVLDREKLSSTYIRHNLAIPHSSGIRALKNFMIVIKNKKAVVWGTHKVHYIIFFGMTSKDGFLNTFDFMIEYQNQLISYIEQQFHQHNGCS